MILLWGYSAYLATTIAFAVVVFKMAARRAVMSGATHLEVALVVAWFDFWIGAYYDRKSHLMYVFPIPMVGFCFNFDAPIVDGDQ